MEKSDNMRFIRKVTNADIAVCDKADSFLQSSLWGAFKSCFGWTARAFMIDWTQYGERPLLTLCRRLAPGISFAYIPWGPELPDGFPEDPVERSLALSELCAALRPFLPKSAAFIRIDPPWYSRGADAPPPVLLKPFLRSAADVQTPDTVILNIDRSEEEILAGMKSQWRYNQRMALKRGLVISRTDEAGIGAFYSLLRETAGRTGIAIHSEDYYKTLFEHFYNFRQSKGSGADLRLYQAEHEGEVLAAMIILHWNATAVYLYAASSDHKRNLMPSFALKIHAILDAHSSGCVNYDLFGIPPNDDPSHPMAGLFRFKTGFGGEIIHRPGCWDYLCRPFTAKLFRTAEALRKKIRDSKKIRSHKRGSQN